MPKTWTTDDDLVESVASNLCDALVLLPKQLLRMDTLMRTYGMPFSHIQILVMLSSGSKTIGDISSTLGIAKPNITPLLDNLSARGLVERVRSSGDKRIVNVRLLDAGRELIDQIHASVAEQVLQWEGSYNRSDIKQLNNSLAQLIALADRNCQTPQRS